LCAVAVGITLTAGSVKADDKRFEVPENRQAADILPAEVIKGPHYRIRDKVVSYGYLHHYTVDSDFGVFKVTGDGALRKLLKEIRAIAALKKIKKTDAYLEAVKRAGASPVQFGVNLITDPQGTLSGLPKGVSRFFGDVSASISKTKDPSEDDRAKQVLQVSAYKREYAYKLGVDVYSSNTVLQEELNSVGWASALGNLSVTAATAPLGGALITTAKAMRLANQVNDLLKENPPSRLRVINEEKLTGMGISKDLSKRFLDHPHFTPRHDTIIVGCLESLRLIKGRERFLQFILSAEDDVSANFFQNMAQTLMGYHESVSPLKEIKIVGGLVLAEAQNLSALIPFPLDHGVWTQRADRILTNLVSSYKGSGGSGKLKLWVTGTLSPLARQQLRLIGIRVKEKVDEQIDFVD
jgi:hypothetical protein